MEKARSQPAARQLFRPSLLRVLVGLVFDLVGAVLGSRGRLVDHVLRASRGLVIGLLGASLGLVVALFRAFFRLVVALLCAFLGLVVSLRRALGHTVTRSLGRVLRIGAGVLDILASGLRQHRRRNSAYDQRRADNKCTHPVSEVSQWILPALMR